MIKHIEINNFRSIIKSSLKLENLTVIVGANATGKSNLIKAIDFISDIPKYGLQDAIYNRGGFGEILPKQHKLIYDKEISIKIEFELEPPTNWSKYGLPPLTVEYEIGLIKTKRNPLKITKERLVAKSILLLQYYFDNDYEDEDDSGILKVFKLDKRRQHDYIASEIQLYRDKQNAIRYSLNFKLTPKNSDLFMGWLGFRNFFNNRQTTSSKEIKNLMKSVIGNRIADKRVETAILSTSRAIFNFAFHFREILNEIKSYGRYDLLISELRQEQHVSSSTRVSITGDNMPSVIKSFIKNNRLGWKRVLTTMSNISPYFSNVYSESLRAGKEYLLFTEVFNGRNIEAWESSDGTLRALAILISVEAHRYGSTVLIEEPEHGLHPWAIKEIIDHIRTVIKMNSLQVIMTTHSQQVLENLNKNELLITERDNEGTHYYSIDNIIPNADISMGEIGELWTRGLLRGVPASM